MSPNNATTNKERRLQFSTIAEKDNGGGAFSLYSTMRHAPRSLLTIIASKQQLFKFDYLSKIPLASVIR